MITFYTPQQQRTTPKRKKFGMHFPTRTPPPLISHTHTHISPGMRFIPSDFRVPYPRAKPEIAKKKDYLKVLEEGLLLRSQMWLVGWWFVLHVSVRIKV
jgi:hypothetical protein